MSAKTPFHRGELEVQDRLGVREEVHGYASRFIRSYLTDEQRAFYAELPMLVVGSVSEAGAPTASLLFGRPGFVSSPDDGTLSIAALPVVGDPLENRLSSEMPLGMLGIELATRRRNRVNGRVAPARDGFALKVDQGFGNCPQHIRARSLEIDDRIDEPRLTPSAQRDNERLDARTRAIVESAGAFFIASAYLETPGDERHGVDVSHRGGVPGFLSIEDDQTLVFPDFGGNRHFNTIGNLALHPSVGLLLVDFETGDLLQIEGRAEIIWEGPLLEAFDGAERFVRIAIERVRHFVDAVPLSFGAAEASINEQMVGSWTQAEATLAARRRDNERVSYEVFDVRDENELVRSLYLRPADGSPVPSRLPGQYLPITLRPEEDRGPLERTYTISNASADHLRISVKRQGAASNHLHDEITVGAKIEARTPAGDFVLDESSDRPILMLSAGIGVTPMMAMLEHLAASDEMRRTYFMHGTRNGREHSFGKRVRDIANERRELTLHVAYSEPTVDNLAEHNHDEVGRLTGKSLRRLLPLDDYDVYLCGPAGFMRTLYDALLELGVREERIRMEAFGPASLPSARNVPDAPVEVRFARSDKTVTWTPQSGTLLQLAESAGIDVPFGCRTGACGTCATALGCGSVTYPVNPSAPLGDGEVAVCTALPSADDGCGGPTALVLEL